MEREGAWTPEGTAARPWWLELETAGLILFVMAAYFLRAGALPIRGEEPTRAQIAREMVESGDYLVPRQQGEPFRIRPPLQNWLIAASCTLLGTWNEWAVRFPSLLATLLTTLLIYGYARISLSRTGALAAAAAFASLADMFQMGRQAETEAIFIFLLSCSLLTWHWGVLRRWPEALTWTCGYSFTALATLTKGIQAPAYFLGSVTVYLVLSGQWRRLLARAHGVGVCLGAAIVAAWAIPYALVMGWREMLSIWFGDPAIPLSFLDLKDYLIHLIQLPLEIAVGTLPWSLLLLVYFRRDFRRSIQEARPMVRFVTASLAVAFPSVWLHPLGGQPRYFAPLYPCLTVLIGLAVQRLSEAGAPAALQAAWRRYRVTMACGMVLLPAGILATTLLHTCRPSLVPWAEPPLLALGYTAAAVPLAALLVRGGLEPSAGGARMTVLALAGFMGLTFTGIFTDIRARRAEDPAGAMKRLKERLPPGQALVSLGGHLDCLFPYYYGMPLVTPRPWPVNDSDPDVSYFCVPCDGDKRPSLPFAWEEVGIIPLDRNRHPVPEGVVVVGRRLPTAMVRGGRATSGGTVR
jgi:4-amino-4-deoxy-L-arabinose transferase-like glycosyltransferase